MNFSRCFFTLSIYLLMTAVTTLCAAQTETVLFSFDVTNGAYPLGRVGLDSKGNLYGATQGGGDLGCYGMYGNGCGVAYELHANSGKWIDQTLHMFTQAGFDGAVPQAGVTLDSKGRVYGTTQFGGGEGGCIGQNGCGTIYELSRSASGWQDSTIFGFAGNDGSGPFGEVVFDAQGNLYGTVCCGGANKGGSVFELTRSGGGKWTQTVLHTFAGGADGFGPLAGLAIDSLGNVYGTTFQGGLTKCHGGCGIAYELSPPTQPAGSWKETILHEFLGESDGAFPMSQLVFDTNGNLYGTTVQGGGLGSCDYAYTVYCGTVFKLTPPAEGGGAWTETIIYSFSGGNDGEIPAVGVTLDSSGNLFGTTMFGGGGTLCSVGCGTVYELKLSGSNWTEIVLHAFDGPDGSIPISPVTLDSSGNIYGATNGGGAHDYGAVFEITP